MACFNKTEFRYLGGNEIPIGNILVSSVLSIPLYVDNIEYKLIYVVLLSNQISGI